MLPRNSFHNVQLNKRITQTASYFICTYLLARTFSHFHSYITFNNMKEISSSNIHKETVQRDVRRKSRFLPPIPPLFLTYPLTSQSFVNLFSLPLQIPIFSFPQTLQVIKALENSAQNSTQQNGRPTYIADCHPCSPTSQLHLTATLQLRNALVRMLM